MPSHLRSFTFGALSTLVPCLSRDNAVPIELAARLRSYFNETNRWRYYDSQSQELLKEMSAKLRGAPTARLGLL